VELISPFFFGFAVGVFRIWGRAKAGFDLGGGWVFAVSSVIRNFFLIRIT
jgi:hypothetical protein